MGKVSKRVLGAVRGAVGDVQFHDWRGLSVVQTYAAENKSQSEKQLEARAALGFLNKSLKHALCPFRIGFYGVREQTEYSRGVQVNYPLMVIDGVFDPSKLESLQLSEGGLVGVRMTGLTITAGQVVVAMTYNPINPCGKNNPSDEIFIAVGHFVPGVGFKEDLVGISGTRSDSSVTIAVPQAWTSDDPENIFVYAFAFRRNGEDNDQSDTSFIMGE